MDGRARRRVTWRRLAVLLALLALVPGAAHAAVPAPGEPCGFADGLRCLTVSVPLDRAGRVPGKVALHVEVLPASPQRGVMFLVAGGPGQGSADVFELRYQESADDFRGLFPGYTLVAVDGRGTGSSGPLSCPMLIPAHLEAPAPAAACARSLGARRDFYGTPDHAEDLDAVRQALGYSRIGLFGVSYGTKLALSYALAHPNRVDRMLLDSVSPPEGDDPYLAGFFAALPRTLARYCAGGACRAATRDFPADVAALANALDAKPARGHVLLADGTRRAERVDGLGFLSLVIEADLNPGVAAELPAATHAARRGDVAPLLRAYELALGGDAYNGVNLALFMATSCRDGPLPWTAGTTLAARRALVEKALAALPAKAFAPFGSWAGRAGNAQACLGWPSPKGGTSLGRGPLPDVPVLALSGNLDLRTPTADARKVVARFPHGQLLVVPGSGHSVLTNDVDGCVEREVHDWLEGLPAGQCPALRAYLAPLGALPDASVAPAGRAATLKLVRRTLREAEATWLLIESSGRHRAAGLHGGTLTEDGDAFVLDGYELVPGVAVSGRIALDDGGPPLPFSGTVAVGGPGTPTGTVVLRSGGSLGWR